MEISNAIIVFLTTIILILLFVVIKLNIQFYNEKKNFKKSKVGTQKDDKT